MHQVSLGAPFSSGVRDFDIHIREGEMVNLIGLSGSGKTILYDYFMGRMPLSGGTVYFRQSVYHAGDYFPSSENIVCVGEKSTLIPGASIAENIFIISDRRKTGRFVNMKDIYYRARILLGQYAPWLSPKTPARNLTMAQVRMVELLRAIENEAEFIIIDDAFQGFGQDDMQRMALLLRQLKERNIAILYESHEIDFFRMLVDKIVVQRQGQAVWTFWNEADYNSDFCRQMLMGESAPPSFTHRSSATKVRTLSVEHLGSPGGLQDVNFQVHRGEIAGVYDLNNRNNMELLQILIGEKSYNQGCIRVEDEIYDPVDLTYAIHRRIGYIPCYMQNMTLVESMNMADNLGLPILKKTGLLGIFCNKKVLRMLEKEYAQKTGLSHEQARLPVRHFDSYTQTEILMARWLLSRPKVLLCMEPFRNTDMIMRNILYCGLEKIAGEGTAILISSQNMNELREICDTVHVLNTGSEY